MGRLVDMGCTIDPDGDLTFDFCRISDVRSFTEEENRAASSAAVLGIIGFLDIPLIHMSVYWWRTLHQPPSILRPDKAPWENVHPAMLTALAINFVGFMLLYFYLLSLRFRLGEIREEIKARLARGTTDGRVGICFLSLWDCVGCDLDLLACTQAPASPRGDGTGAIGGVRRSHKKMRKRRRFIIGGLIILAAFSYIIYGGMQQAIVYFVTPSELKAKEKRFHRQIFAHGRDGGQRIAAKRRARTSLTVST